MLQDFKAFIAKGNVLDLAVAVIIGAIFGGADLSNHFILLSVPADYKGSLTDYAALKEAGAAMIGWGAFINAIVNFLILAFVIFLLVRWANRLTPKKEEAPAGPSEIDLLAEIRDELRKRS